MINEVIKEAFQAGLPSSAVEARLIRVYGIDAGNAKKLVAALGAKVKRKAK